MNDHSDLKSELSNLKEKIINERDKISEIADLVNRQIEREVGIWEYDFDELEKEMWKRFGTLEENSECAAAAQVSRLQKLYRKLTSPFSRTVIDRQFQFNLDQQNRVNRESIPFHLAVILYLQKIKDRLNTLEEIARKMHREQEELFKELQITHSPGTTDKEK